MKSVQVLIAFFVLGCAAGPLEDVAYGNQRFTADVYKQLLKTHNGNFIYSGLSAEIILSLVANGAKGQTQKELLNALHLPNNQKVRDAAFSEITSLLNVQSTNLELSSANKLYPQLGFEVSPAFKKNAVDVYKSDVQNLDYRNAQAAADTINQWVESKTNNKIKNLIDPSQLSPSTVLVLVNALYLLGKWVHPFQPSKTQQRPFYTSETESKQVDMMYTSLTARYTKCTSLKAEFLELDLRDSNITMGFILPATRTGLSAIENNLNRYMGPVRMKETYIGVYLPRFEIETKIDFTTVLQNLGVSTIFTNQADLTGISSAGGLKVSFVVQKAFINVTESGVEAAAATGVGIMITSVREGPKIEFNADHPFMYYIKDKETDVVLFAGRFNGSK